MAKKICIFLMAVLFLASVAGVHASPIKSLKNPHWSSNKLEKIKFKSFLESKKDFHRYISHHKFKHFKYKFKNKRKWCPKPPDAVPIPSTLILLGTGLIGLIGLRRRKSKK